MTTTRSGPATSVPHGRVEQLDEQILRPVHVLDEQPAHRPVAALSPLEEVDRRLLQAVRARRAVARPTALIEGERVVLADELLVEQVAGEARRSSACRAGSSG